jgi:uncharacterized protein involved in outer membrane biogenesis
MEHAMRKWSRRLVRLLAAAVSVVLLLGLAAFLLTDRLAGDTIRQVGTARLGVATDVEEVQVAWLDQEVALRGLRIANPQGFEAPHLLTLDVVDVRFDVTASRPDRLVIPHLELRGLTLNIERERGRTNYQHVLKAVRKRRDMVRLASAPAGPPSSASLPARVDRTRSVVIQHLVIRDATANVKLDVLGRTTRVRVPLPDLELHDIETVGQARMQLTAVSAQVAQTVFAQVVRDASPSLPDLLEHGLAQVVPWRWGQRFPQRDGDRAQGSPATDTAEAMPSAPAVADASTQLWTRLGTVLSPRAGRAGATSSQ